jgi:peptide/nickel transport system substrate-binding protein
MLKSRYSKALWGICIIIWQFSLAQPYQESPILNAQVQAGDLPPIQERLPDNPLVVEPLEQVGTYGGTLRRGSVSIIGYLTNNFTREPLTTWQMPLPSAGPPMANIAESWEYNDEGTEVTVRLRAGMKWSDGEPFTTGDIDFFWNDIMLDDNVTEGFPGILRVNGEVPELEIIDDLTFKFTFPATFYYFAEAHASIWQIAWPKHYLSQYHPKYNDSASYDDINAQVDWQNGRGRVTLQAWMLDEYIPGEILKLKRNPYYWKVDTAGNQLPYFDYAEVRIVEDRQAVALGNITGDLDLDAMWVGVQHLQLFTQAIQQGRDVRLGFADIPSMVLRMNLDVADDAKREALRSTDFRRALSLAINRQEISDVLFSGLLEPAGSVFSPLTPYHREEDARSWAEYDPEAATQLLESAGFVDINGNGFRETPSGAALQLIIDVGQHDLYTPAVEMITEYWEAIGVRAIMNVQDQSLVSGNYDQGNFEISAWDFYGADAPLTADMRFLASVDEQTPAWHLNWQSDPISEDFLRVNEVLTTATTMPYDERVEALREVNSLMADNVWYIHLGFYRRPFIVSNRIGNAPEVIARDSQVNDMPPFRAEQLFERYSPGTTGQ